MVAPPDVPPSFPWVAVSAIASAISAAIALTATLVNLWAMRRTGRATDFNNCLSVISQLAEAQRKVRDAKGDEIKQFEFRELLNLMEGLALLENDKLTASSTKKITEDFLIETWAFLRSQEHIQKFLSDSMTDVSTFEQLRKFGESHSIKIRDLALHYERQQRTTDAAASQQ